MAKRYACERCVVKIDPTSTLPKERMRKRFSLDQPEQQFEVPLFRSQRKLARHLQQVHKDDKTAQREAEQLLVKCRLALRYNRNKPTYDNLKGGAQ